MSVAQQHGLRLGGDIKARCRNQLPSQRRRLAAQLELGREFLEMLRRAGRAGLALRAAAFLRVAR